MNPGEIHFITRRVRHAHHFITTAIPATGAHGAPYNKTTIPIRTDSNDRRVRHAHQHQNLIVNHRRLLA